jgi:hypothetical protein
MEFPTTIVDLPSKGYYYSKDNPLSKGEIECSYMVGKSEDILSSVAYIRKGIVIDKLLESLIVDKTIKYGDLLAGDISQIMVAARVSGYGSKYPVSITCKSCGKRNDVVANLEELHDAVVKFPAEPPYKNEFTFTLPISKQAITFKLLTRNDLTAIRKETESLAILDEDLNRLGTTRMKYSILSIHGDNTQATIRNAVDNMPVADARAFRENYKTVDPDVDFTINFTCSKCGATGREDLVLDETFFWPDTRL